MTKKESIKVPDNAPKLGEVYKHYKGDLYKVLFLAMHNDPDEICVVYTGLYDGGEISLYTRILSNWDEEVDWEGKKIKRFTKI